MPTGSYYKKVGKRSYTRRKPGKGRKNFQSVRTATGKGMKVTKSLNTLLHTPMLPLEKYAVLPYYDSNTISAPIVGASTAYVFSANGLFDPNVTGTGHQPMGFDQMMLFYEHYTVTNVKVTVNYFNTDIDDTAIVGILVAPDATVETVTSKLNENGMLVKKIVQPNNSGQNHGTMTVNINLNKINGKKDVTSEDDFRGDIASNPAEQTYIHLFSYNPMSANSVALSFEVILEYTAKFTEPRKMVQS